MRGQMIALLLISAPLVSGFAAMGSNENNDSGNAKPPDTTVDSGGGNAEPDTTVDSGGGNAEPDTTVDSGGGNAEPDTTVGPTCGDNEGWLQTLMLTAPDGSFGETDPRTITCAEMPAEICVGPPEGQMYQVICAGTCKYSGACKGDDALASLIPTDATTGEKPKCATLPELETSMMGLAEALEVAGGTITDSLGNPVDPEQATAAMAAMFKIAKDVCGTPSRARKLTDAPRMDASKAHKLAAAMLRSIKTTAHRLAQVRGLGQ